MYVHRNFLCVFLTDKESRNFSIFPEEGSDKVNDSDVGVDGGEKSLVRSMDGEKEEILVYGAEPAAAAAQN
jgi:hypothetical protein